MLVARLSLSLNQVGFVHCQGILLKNINTYSASIILLYFNGLWQKMTEPTTIGAATFDWIKQYGDYGQTTDDILNKILDNVEKERLRKIQEDKTKKLKMRLDWLEFWFFLALVNLLVLILRNLKLWGSGT